MTCGITYVLVGYRDLEKMVRSICLIREYAPNIHIKVYHDVDLNKEKLSKYKLDYRKYDRIRYNSREENRNSSYWRLVSLLESKHDVTLYLDNDIFVVHPGFFEGFKIANFFGLAMVQNPRYFIKTYEGDTGDLDIGADVLKYDKDILTEMPHYMTSYNMGVMFCPSRDKSFIADLVEDQELNPSRGQAGLYRGLWRNKRAPYCLPVNWLVCKKHIGIDKPLALHVGHTNIYNWWSTEFKLKIKN